MSGVRKYLVTASQMQELDQMTIEKIGIPALVLMERAALAVCDEIRKRFAAKQQEDKEKCPGKCLKALIFAGVGNNGADGLALARMLKEDGFEVDVIVLGDPLKATQQWKIQSEILSHYSVRCGSEIADTEYDILVDAIFGVGLSREITGHYAEMIRCFNQMSGYKVAVDVPSGIHSDNGAIMGCAVAADLTVCFAQEKRGLFFYPGCEYAGQVVVKNIGIRTLGMESQYMFHFDCETSDLLPKRAADGNKGSFGKVLIAAGSANMAGAAVLAGKAACRSGVGMVKILTEECNRLILQITVPEALLSTWKKEEAKEAAQNILDVWPDALAIGPGLGTGEDGYQLLMAFLEYSSLPLLIDADGLNLIAAHEELAQNVSAQAKAGRCIILTPHVGELSRLLKQSIGEIKQDFTGAVMTAAEKFGCIIVGKDARTLVGSVGSPIYMNTSGNSGMATAGSGDVLSGMIAGLLAQGMSGFEAACTGVYVHGLAGDAAASQIGKRAMTAADIVNAIHCVIE